MSRKTKSPRPTPKSPAVVAINRILAATEKAYRAETASQALRDKTRDRLLKTGALPGTPRTFA